jgi:hypothetical protein
MHTIAEVAEDIFRVNCALPDSPVTFSFFVIRDEEPALVETGFGALFDGAITAVRSIVDPRPSGTSSSRTSRATRAVR